jgi:hypothetical protein
MHAIFSTFLFLFGTLKFSAHMMFLFLVNFTVLISNLIASCQYFVQSIQLVQPL